MGGVREGGVVTVAGALVEAMAARGAAGIADSRFEARLLIQHVLGLERGAVLDRAAILDGAALRMLVVRRAAHEPMALILGRQGFWTLELEVSGATLIPRADSETIVEAALATSPGADSVLDLGTGTGCLLLAVLSELPGAWGLGVDRSAAAVALAARNAVANGLAARAFFVCSDWAAPIRGRFALILANPPYVESQAIAGLMPEVAKFEPISALDGGRDGLDAYRALMPGVAASLAPGGAVVLEIGAEKRAPVTAIAAGQGLFVAEVRADLAGIPRAMVLRAGQP